MSINPLVSVIIPAYNCKAWIADAIDSVLKQTCSFYEIIVIDDGSTDDLRSFLKEKYGDTIKYAFQQNSGLSAARNRGLDEAKGAYIQFLDCDDLIVPEKLEAQLLEIKDVTGPALSICDYSTCDIDDLNKARPDRYLSPIILNDDPMIDFISRWESEFSMPPHCFLFSAAFFKDYKVRFDETLPTHEDWDCWMKIFALKPVIKYVDKKYAIYRIRSSGMCYDSVKMKDGYLKAIENQVHLLKHDIALIDLLSKKRATLDYSNIYKNVILDEQPSALVRDYGNEQDRLIAGWDRLLAQRDRELEQKAREITGKDLQLKEKNQQLSEKDRQLAEKDRQLAEKDQRIEDLQQSLSWKITAPLRKGYKLLGTFGITQKKDVERKDE